MNFLSDFTKFFIILPFAICAIAFFLELRSRRIQFNKVTRIDFTKWSKKT